MPANDENTSKKSQGNAPAGKLKESFESLKKNEKVEQIYNYATANTRDTVAYVLLITGLVLMFFEPSWYGSAIVGIIFGLYFGTEILDYAKNYEEIIAKEGMVRCLVASALLLAFFIASPFIFIGAAVAVAIRHFLREESR